MVALEVALIAFLVLVVIAFAVLLYSKQQRVEQADAQLKQMHARLQEAGAQLQQMGGQLHEKTARLQQTSAQLEKTSAQNHEARAYITRIEDVARRYRGVLDVEDATRQLEAQRVALAGEIQSTRAAFQGEQQHLSAEIQRLRHELALLTEEEYFVTFGIYQPRYDFETSEKYKKRLTWVRDQQKATVKADGAAVCPITWHVGGDLDEGRKMVKNQLKLMLRAFNGECDAAIAKVRYDNIEALEQRIVRTRDALNALGSVKKCSITDAYLRLKLDELHLFHEYQVKKEEEKEEQKRIREEMREEKRAQQELDRALRQAEEEEHRYREALEKAQSDVQRATGAKHDKLLRQIESLQQRLAEAESQRERAVSRAQCTRAGHVYVLSNIGSFGEQVYKIGMTRRDEPMDRVKELGDASVPFPFDVHAMIRTDDAPTLENELHRRFGHRRVNLVNERKEYFNVSLNDIVSAVHELHGEIEFTLAAEAGDYRQSVALRKRQERAVPNQGAPASYEAAVAF